MTAGPHRFTAESVGRALDVLGERWTLLILREAFFGVRRYAQFARNLGIPRPTLSARLKQLVDQGVLDRVVYATDPDRHEYRLTDTGKEIFPALVILMRWGDEHLPLPDGPPLVLRHSCGEPVAPQLSCTHCGEEITTANVTPEPGPGYREE